MNTFCRFTAVAERLFVAYYLPMGILPVYPTPGEISIIQNCLYPAKDERYE